MRLRWAGLILFFFTLCRGQDTAFYYSANICDEESGLPVANAKVSLCGTMRGVYTDAAGAFTFLVKKTRAVLEITAPGYFTAHIVTPMLIAPGNKIQLRPYPCMASPAPDPSWEKVFRPGKWELLDFECAGKGVVLLAKEKGGIKNYVLFVSEKGDVLYSALMPEELSGFYTDSDNQKYILSSGKARAFVADAKKGIRFTQEFPLKSFEKKKYSWPFADSSGKYLRFDSPDEYYLNNQLELMVRQQAVTYYVQLKKEGRRSLFKNFPDEKFQRSPGPWKKYLELNLTRLPPGARNVCYVKIPVQVVQCGSHITVFDFENHKTEVFDSLGKPQTSATLLLPPGIAEGRIITDPPTGKMYYCALQKIESEGKESYLTLLSEINPVSGRIVQKLKLNPVAYYHLKVYNGYAYFLRSENNAAGNFFLARTKL